MINKQLIKKQDWDYYLYKIGCNYELLVPIPNPAPGFDVKHILNTEEKENFINLGIEVLEDRIKDMKENCFSYVMIPWR